MDEEIREAFEKVAIVKAWYSKQGDAENALSNFAAVELLDELGVI